MQFYKENGLEFKNNLGLGLLIILTIVFLNALGPYLQLQKITTYGLVPLLFLIALKYNYLHPFRNKTEFLLVILIFLTSLISAFTYVNYGHLITGYTRQLSVILIVFIPLVLNNKYDYTDYFHIGYILSILTLIYIMYISNQFSLQNFASEIVQRDKFLINANTYSYLMFFANFSLFYLFQKYKRKFLLILLIIIPVLFVIVSFVTQSRSGMLILILSNVIYWLLINKIEKPTKIQKLLRSLTVILILFFLAFQFWGLYKNSTIKNRFDVTGNRVDARELLIIEAFDVFTENIIFGVGLDQIPNYTSIRQFSHNSYVEILAEQGIIGGVLLLLLFGLPLRQCIIYLLKNPKDMILKLNLLFLVMFYFYNIFYPFYKFGFSMLYFFLILSIQYKKIKEIENKPLELLGSNTSKKSINSKNI
ncbi:O-antigen ligase family protein [uncultured Maribacter sp.]|uniref:O-antigen ligase family protein n=1 Tax=uncultured Maribacter sp. TaxID=431308 RepID=UPI0030DA6AC1|tara:strand:+ start:10273 stop:11532 length:1260 start_codon:yes stop_codon:yes gene_type:complete